MTTKFPVPEGVHPPPSFWPSEVEPNPIEAVTTDGPRAAARSAAAPPQPRRDFGTDIIGRSPALRAVLKEVRIVAPTNTTVLIHGETGTGKELIARAVHNLSPRHDHVMSKINCSAIPAGLLESELFGHERGAFTGAFARKLGRFELAHQGTLFLDEVGDLPAELQPKLLRVLQEHEFERLGGTQTQRVNVRVVAATSHDLSRMVVERQFRSDLFYRLNVFPLRLPPLRDRREDIPLLARHFMTRFARQMNKHIETIPPEVMNSLKRYPWPGNIRELQNCIERAVIRSSGPVLHSPLAEAERTNGCATVGAIAPTAAARVATLEDCEREHILQTLKGTRWVVGGPNGAAALLGVKRTTLIWKMQKLGIGRKTKLAPQSA